ncbi:hypothetical protein JW962_02485 [Candidatus Dojkabacteria bacterium]|nr:hypothetical protein [Candidatus Dojkabacteria bacterium]
MQLGFSSIVSADVTSLAELLDFIPRIVSFIWPLIGILLFGMFVYGGFMWAIAGGNPQNVQKARNIILWAVIGTVVAFGSVIIMNIFGSVLGVPNLTTIRIF